MAFNDRTAVDGVYVYPKESLAPWGEWYVVLPPGEAYDTTSFTRWMEDECPLETEDDKSTELDWLQFFWDAWTHTPGYETLDAGEMMQIWDGTSSYRFDDLTDEAGDLWGDGDERRKRFWYSGGYAGVRHCLGGCTIEPW
jgi:hypothetical protein